MIATCQSIEIEYEDVHRGVLYMAYYGRAPYYVVEAFPNMLFEAEDYHKIAKLFGKARKKLVGTFDNPED